MLVCTFWLYYHYLPQLLKLQSANRLVSIVISASLYPLMMIISWMPAFISWVWWGGGEKLP